MHTWPPESAESKEHLARLDKLFGEMADAAPMRLSCPTADHGMNHKTHCWDLDEDLRRARRPHSHRNLGRQGQISTASSRLWWRCLGLLQQAWRYRSRGEDGNRRRGRVELVLSRSEAARRYHLFFPHRGRIVLGDKDTVFGELTSTSGAPSHRVPRPWIVARDGCAARHPQRSSQARRRGFHYNWELARWLYPA